MKNTLKPGDNLGPFKLLCPIGEGGMGRVWAARDESAAPRPRLVAIKTAIVEDAATEGYWKVLLDEARIAYQVQHPNVCAIHAFEQERGIAYLVMDWSDGASLRELLDAMPNMKLPANIAVRIMAEICSGLHAAHELTDDEGECLNVVHRDVSPQNVLISRKGHVKITDFGVAKARGRIHAPTQTGEVKGKLAYMPPEQVTSREVDRRADVFAMGCILYEATVGESPFRGDDALATLYQLLEQPLVRPSEKVPDYSPSLEPIVLKALERDPAARFQTAEEMGRALQGWLASERNVVVEAHVAKVLDEALHDEIFKRNQKIERVAAAIEKGEPIGEVEDDHTPDPPTALYAEKSGAGPRRGVLWAAVAALAAVVTTGAVFASREPPGKTQPSTAGQGMEQPNPPSEEPRAADTEAQKVVVMLSAEPAHATLYVDDGPALGNPHRLTVASDDGPHRVRAVAEGFAEQTQNVSFDRNKEVLIVLLEAPKPVSSRPRPGSQAKPPTLGPVPTPSTDEPAMVRKPPRSLDSDNPFKDEE